MNKEATAFWPKDFATDLPMVPPGEFTTFEEYPSSTQPAQVRKLPVLKGYFDANGFDQNPELPTHVGWGTVPVGDKAVALTFRIQRGPNMLYWLANPADKHVWAVLDKWAAAKRMVLAAEFQDGTALLLARDFELHPKLSSMRVAASHATRLTPEFIVDASLSIARDQVRLFASTDIPAYPELQHVQACMVRTEVTRGVALMVDEGMPSADGPLADAITALTKAMLRPTERRH